MSQEVGLHLSVIDRDLYCTCGVQSPCLQGAHRFRSFFQRTTLTQQHILQWQWLQWVLYWPHPGTGHSVSAGEEDGRPRLDILNSPDQAQSTTEGARKREWNPGKLLSGFLEACSALC